MRFPLPWVSATTFGFVGLGLAAAMAVPGFGSWGYLPAAAASTIVVYVVSTWLGILAARKSYGLAVSMLLGVSVALATLGAGVLAFGLTNTLLAWIEEVVIAADLGLGVYGSISTAFRSWVIGPTVAVFVYGGWIAIILGVIYGTTLHRQRKSDTRMSPNYALERTRGG